MSKNELIDSNSSSPQSNHKTTIYPFPQEPTKVTHTVVNGIEILKDMGVNKAHILDIYMDAQKYAQISAKKGKKQSEPISSPYHYLSALNAMSKEARAVTAEDYIKAYNSTLLDWKDITPLDFMQQYEAHLFHKKNDSGLENGMISTRLFARITSGMGLLIVNPSASFLKHITQNKKLNNVSLTFAFENPRYASIYTNQKWNGDIRCISIEEIDLSVRYTSICIMGASTSYHAITKLLDDCSTKLDPLCKIFLLMPTAYADRRAQGDPLRATINTNFDVLQIVLIDANAVNIKPKKRCMMVLQRKNKTPTVIPIQQVYKTDKHLLCREIILVPYDEFLLGRKTLNALYVSKKAPPLNQKSRTPPRPLQFSLEITLYYSVEHIHSAVDKYRGKYRYYDYPSETQARRNYFARGSVLTSFILGKTVESLDQIYDDGERLLMSHEELSQVIRETVSLHVQGRAVDIKTFWYVFLPNLLSNPKYDDALCRRLFLGSDWISRRLCHLMIGKSTTEDIQYAVTEYCDQNNISNTRKEKIYEQLAILWNLAIEKRFPGSNPVNKLLEIISSRNEIKEDMSDGLVLRSLTLGQMQVLDDFLNQDISNPTLALITKMKLYMRLGSGEAAALTIGDYLKVPNHSLKLMSITKSLPQIGDKAEPFLRPSQNNILPVPSVLANKLDEYIKDRIDVLLALGVSEAEINKYPLFASASNPCSPIRTRRINEYVARHINKLNMPEIWLYNPDDDIGADIGKYRKDLLVANWEHHAVQTIKLDADAISYVSGRTPESVVGSHYRDFTHPLQLEALKIELERLIAKVELPQRVADSSTKSITLNMNRRYFPFQPCSEPTEMVFNIDLSDGEEVFLDADVPYGCRITIEYM